MFTPRLLVSRNKRLYLCVQVNEAVLKKVIEWCEHHKHDPPSASDDDDNRRKTTDIDEWDQKFMQVDQEMLFEIILVRFVLDSLFDTYTDRLLLGRQLLGYQGPP